MPFQSINPKDQNTELLSSSLPMNICQWRNGILSTRQLLGEKKQVLLVADLLALHASLQEIGQRWEKLTELLKCGLRHRFDRNENLALNLLST